MITSKDVRISHKVSVYYELCKVTFLQGLVIPEFHVEAFIFKH